MSGKYFSHKGPRRVLTFLLTLAMLVGSLGFGGIIGESAFASEDSVEVTFSFVYDDTFEVIPQKLNVSAGLAYRYGIGEVATEYPTVLDAVVAAHEVKYGDEFMPETAVNYLDENLFLAFQKIEYFGHAINRTYSGDAAKDARLYNGDVVELFCYLDDQYFDYYTIFTSESNVVDAGSNITLTLKGFCYCWDGYLNPTPLPVAGAAVSIIDTKTGDIIVMDSKTTDSEGQVTLNFDTEGEYYISAIGNVEVALEDAPIIPTWYKVTVIDPKKPHAEGFVTVRIEGSGHGTDGINNGIDTILDETLVPLVDLPEEPTALDAINKALSMEGLDPATLSDDANLMPISFGGVTYEAGYDWSFIHNEAVAQSGIATQPIESGDSLVIYLSADWDSGNYLKDPYYSYFAKKSLFFSDEYGPYAEVSLILKHIIPADWETVFEDSVEIVADAAVSVTASAGNDDNYNCSTNTDSENGTLDFSCWGVGEYIISATKIVDGKNTISRPYCKITLSENTVEISAYSTAMDTDLKTLSLDFGSSAPINGMGYLNKDAMTVNNAVTTVNISATARDNNASVTAKYKAANDDDFSEYELEDGNSIGLAVGDNIFKITVTNDTDTQIYTLIITREDNKERDIAAEVSAVINGVKTVKGYQPVTDWILAMNGAGLTILEEDVTDYLAAVLPTIDDFADSGTGNVGTIAKIAIALTSLGIDVRQIADPDGGDAPINLIKQITNYSGSVDKYSASYILSLYDLEDVRGEKIYPLPVNHVLTREALLSTILSAQNPETGLFGSIDDTGITLPALAPYYLAEEADEFNGIGAETINTVKAAVGTAVTALSGKQTIDGGFGAPNANTTSIVITGLAALNIDPHGDERFIKSGSTLITNLLTFRTRDDKLGYTSNDLSNDYASVQGFQALAAYQNLTDSQSSNIYHFPAEVVVYTNWPDAKLLSSIAVTTQPKKTTYQLNEGEGSVTVDTEGMVVTAYYNADPLNYKIIDEGYTVSEIDTTSPGTKSVIVTYQGHTATFTVTVKGSGGSVPEEKTVKITVKSSGKGTIASDSSYVIQPGVTSVMDVLKAVLSEAGKTYVIQGNAYVSEIDGLGEFSSGTNSGWLYYVDGEDPGISAGSYKLDGGEVIQWIYTLDYTKEKGSEKWNETLLPEETTGTIDKKSLIAVLKDIEAGKADSWTLGLALGDIVFDKDALAGLLDQMDASSVDITIEQVSGEDLSGKQRETIGDRPVYDINITSERKNISKIGGKLTISLSYTLKEGESHSGIVVYHLDKEGKLGPVESAYDPVAGKVEFTVDHLSYFVIGYDETLAKWPFKDVEADKANWYYEPVKFVYERGLFAGTSNNTFDPDKPMTRAMLVSVIARLHRVELTEYKDVPFNDVDINSWYGPSVAWAWEAGVISGYKEKDGTVKFDPMAMITRQDLAAILYRYADKYNKSFIKPKNDSIKFVDQNMISPYAADAVVALQRAGIINGVTYKEGIGFIPWDNGTRAETATMFYNMLNQ